MAVFNGTPGADSFTGDGGNDTFNGISFNDSVNGGGGSDVISIDLSTTALNVVYDAVAAATSGGTVPVAGMSVRNVEQLGTLVTGSGSDTLIVSRFHASFSWTAGTGTDLLVGDYTGDTSGIVTIWETGRFLVYVGTSGTVAQAWGIEAVRITGGSAQDYIGGTAGDDSLAGAGGADRVFGEGGNDTLNGGAASDWLYGGDGNDLMSDGSGGSEMHGDAGNDSITGGSGNDEVLGGSGNDTLNGGGEADRLYGGEGDDRVSAGAGNDFILDDETTEDAVSGRDTLFGGDGDDQIFSYRGVDTIDGGAGFDTIRFERPNATLSYVIDMVAGATSAGTALVDGGLIKNVEVGYFVLGSGNDLFYGGAGRDIVFANLGNDTLYGGALYNELFGDAGDDRLYGGGGEDALDGSSGQDLLDGQAGADMMSGGTGNDTYYVDNTGDIIFEIQNEGTDILYCSVDYSLAWKVIEYVVITGSADVSFTGNSLANHISGNSGNNRIDGLAGIDTMAGGAGNDTYVISVGADQVEELSGQGDDLVETWTHYTLSAHIERLVLMGTAALSGTGNDGANVLTGNSGKNNLTGGLGDDTYYVQNSDDRVIENAGEGNDLIVASVSYSLTGRYAETLELVGTGDFDATGNSVANTLLGNAGANTLNGLGGNDTLTGSGGADIFLFETGSRKDTVTDFDSGEGDSIDIHAYTGGVSNGSLVSQAGANVLIDLGGGNVVTVLNAIRADVLSHVIW